MPGKKINTYAPKAFTARYMPSQELYALLKGDFERFFILRVEEMYRHLRHAVSASRTVNHICIFITEGRAHIKIGREQLSIGKDEMLFVPAGQVVSFEEHDINKGYLCCFHNEMLLGKLGSIKLLQELDFLKVWGHPVVRPDKRTAGYILQLLKRMLQEYRSNGLQHVELLQAYCIAMLCEAKEASRPALYEGEHAAVQITRRFRELLVSHIKTLHQVTDYAALLAISPNHLNKAVKKTSGKTTTQWIDEAIVIEAKVLLGQTELSISEIALELNFEDQSYFARLFKKYEQVSPTDYRKRIEKSR